MPVKHDVMLTAVDHDLIRQMDAHLEAADAILGKLQGTLQYGMLKVQIVPQKEEIR